MAEIHRIYGGSNINPQPSSGYSRPLRPIHDRYERPGWERWLIVRLGNVIGTVGNWMIDIDERYVEPALKALDNFRQPDVTRREETHD